MKPLSWKVIFGAILVTALLAGGGTWSLAKIFSLAEAQPLMPAAPGYFNGHIRMTEAEARRLLEIVVNEGDGVFDCQEALTPEELESARKLGWAYIQSHSKNVDGISDWLASQFCPEDILDLGSSMTPEEKAVQRRLETIREACSLEPLQIQEAGGHALQCVKSGGNLYECLQKIDAYCDQPTAPGTPSLPTWVEESTKG